MSGCQQPQVPTIRRTHHHQRDGDDTGHNSVVTVLTALRRSSRMGEGGALCGVPVTLTLTPVSATTRQCLGHVIDAIGREDATVHLAAAG